MTNPIITIHNATTGEVETREMNAEELAQLEKDRAEQEAQAAEQAAKEEARLAALNKLKAIGLTDEEIAALVGA